MQQFGNRHRISAPPASTSTSATATATTYEPLDQVPPAQAAVAIDRRPGRPACPPCPSASGRRRSRCRCPRNRPEPARSASGGHVTCTYRFQRDERKTILRGRGPRRHPTVSGRRPWMHTGSTVSASDPKPVGPARDSRERSRLACRTPTCRDFTCGRWAHHLRSFQHLQRIASTTESPLLLLMFHEWPM